MHWIDEIETRIVNDSKGQEGVRIVNPNTEPMPTIRAGGGGHQLGWRIEQDETDISRYAIGAEWDKLKPGEQSEKYFSLVRTDPESPCPTVSQRGGDGSDATVTHPAERRKFTIAELKRICAFPDDFILTGSYAQQWERLGRAVPPLMMRAVAESLKGVLAQCAE
jgi:DNA (cytosine-5)-methyltransferase 1